MGYKIFTHEIRSSYAARVDNFRSYDTISKDIMQRWTYPLVPDVQYFGNCLGIKVDRQGVYKAPGKGKNEYSTLAHTQMDTLTAHAVFFQIHHLVPNVLYLYHLFLVVLCFFVPILYVIYILLFSFLLLQFSNTVFCIVYTKLGLVVA